MEVTHIPKSFWHTLSICMLIATIGVVYIAYRSSSVSIEIANAKINLSSAIATTKEIKSDLEKENERLKMLNSELNAELQRAEKEVAKVITDPAVDIKAILGSKALGSDNAVFRKMVIEPKVFEQLNTQIEKAESAIN